LRKNIENLLLIMPREIITPEQRELEAAALRLIFEELQSRNESVTQESIAAEMEVTQGLINQWLTGRTPIPAPRLIWLSRKYKFDPSRVRPSINPQIGMMATEKEKKTVMLYLTNPDFAKIVDTIAESAGIYQSEPRANAAPPEHKGPESE
jgi:transcriptional regulator with XRE-family HTH domain